MKTLVVDLEEMVKIGKKAPTNGHRVYVWLSQQFNGSIIVDAGTSNGKSALAFSANPTNLVLTYDTKLVDRYEATLTRLSSIGNVLLKRLSCNLISPEWFSHVDIILLDIDPHDSIKEAEFLKRIEPHFKGILLMDDVNDSRWPDLSYLFNSLEREHQLIKVGTCNGVGIVAYGDWTVEIK